MLFTATVLRLRAAFGATNSFSLIVTLCFVLAGSAHAFAASPEPLLKNDSPVKWWFVFKHNAAIFPKCSPASAARACPFGGTVRTKTDKGKPYVFGQQFVFASNQNGTLQQGDGCVGDTDADPLGATFDRVYNGSFNFLVWNDQFYQHPKVKQCGNDDSCEGPWGHSKGVLAWDANGDGVVLQVTTPSWPGSGTKAFPRPVDGNTLGCVNDDNVKVSQHFFALKLDKAGVMAVLRALDNASVVTDASKNELRKIDGPPEIKNLVQDLNLGELSKSKTVLRAQLSPDVELISKPSKLNVPPWQMISALLDGTPLRAATWFTNPQIWTTTQSTPIRCWDESLGKPGAVQIATSGTWMGKKFALTGGLPANGNHAKIGVTTAGAKLTIFGDMNQQGALVPVKNTCDRSQNGRGGLFFVVKDDALFASVTNLIAGDTAPNGPPKKAKGSKSTTKKKIKAKKNKPA